MHQSSNSGLQLQRRHSVMAESRRHDNNRKIEALEEEVQKVRELAEKTAQDQAGLRRRMDALDKCTLLVVENSSKIEELYKTATETRNFKTLSKDAAEAVLKELAQLMKLPSPLPNITPEEWQQLTAATAALDIGLVRKWWKLSEALTQAVKFVTPNKARLPEMKVLEIGTGSQGTSCYSCTSETRHS